MFSNTASYKRLDQESRPAVANSLPEADKLTSAGICCNNIFDFCVTDFCVYKSETSPSLRSYEKASPDLELDDCFGPVMSGWNFDV